MPLSAAVFLLALLLFPRQVHSVEIAPFYTQNQSPVVQIFGLPQGGREDAPRNRLLYTYAKDGQNRLIVLYTSPDVAFHLALKRIF